MRIDKALTSNTGHKKMQSKKSNWLPDTHPLETPLRSELFSADQMAIYGQSLAASHQLGECKTNDFLLQRLASNEEILINVCSMLTLEVANKRSITPAGGWLLDNFYLIEEQIRTAKRHLPQGYSRELPRLSQGPSAQNPRVYDIALETIAHGDGRIDMDSFSRFMTAYQTESPLKLGELWAIPIMLRLAIIENLRRVAVLIATRTTDRNLAGYWADQMIATAEVEPKNLILLIADMARSNPPIVSAFVAELVRCLQGRGPALALPLTWIEQQLSESSLTIDYLVQLENQQQAADQVSISNSIGSLRTLGSVDWRTFVEAMSVVEQILSEDAVYGQMDFASRDRYRHVVEAIAKNGKWTEPEVARHAVKLSAQAADQRAQHVGYFLLDQGLPELEKAAQVSSYAIWKKKIHPLPVAAYLGAIT
ncbi:MAG: cyclic beta 1-2 glucan synthetase, partial [Deefgea sp.]